jgi:hypothetical protein
VTRAAVLFAAATLGALALTAAPAQAHLIPAEQGTVNVVGDGVFVVLSVPTSALHGADDDGDGVVDLAEFQKHEAQLKAEIDRRMAIFDGSALATTVQVDLVLSPRHDGAPGADQVVALKHARFDAAPRDLRVRCDLFGAGAAEQKLTITATRHPASGVETEVVALVPGTTEHAFFAPVKPATATAATEGGLRGYLAFGLLFGVATALSWSGRARGKKAVAPA